MTFMSRAFANMVVKMAYATDFSGQSQQQLSRARAAVRARSATSRAAAAAARGVPAR